MKGKRRETYELEDVTSTTSETPNLPTELTVRFTEGIPDVTFSIDGSYTVKDVKILVSYHLSFTILWDSNVWFVKIDTGIQAGVVQSSVEVDTSRKTPLGQYFRTKRALEIYGFNHDRTFK